MRELLNKFWRELEHFKNGGDVEAVYDDGSRGVFVNLYSPERIRHLLIKDEYYTFRKALIEGKTVQCCGHLPDLTSNSGSMDKGEWFDIIEGTSLNNSLGMGPDYYRIKPDEPEFKAGDWVRTSNDSVYQITELNLIHGTEHFIPWEPKYDELCLFWQKSWESRNNHVILARFKGTLKGLYQTQGTNTYECCQPFIGESPPHLKD